MNVTLVEALGQLQLQPGQCRRIQVNGYEVEIRRLPEQESALADAVMLEPWVWFPDPTRLGTLAVQRGILPLPDPPLLPPDEGTSA